MLEHHNGSHVKDGVIIIVERVNLDMSTIQEPTLINIIIAIIII